MTLYLAIGIFLIFGIMSGSPSPSSRVVLFSLLYSYFAYWAIFAYLNAKDGKFSSPFWWPFLPFICIIKVILLVPRFIVYIFTDRKRFYNIFLKSLFPVIIVFLFAFFSRYLEKYRDLLTIILFSIMAIPIAIAVFLLGKQIYEWSHDRIRWYYWRKKHSGPISLTILLDEFNEYKMPKFCAIIMNFIRDRRLLLSDKGTKSELQEFAFAVE